MSFQHVPPGQFSIDLLKQMQVAYDAATKALAIGANDPRSAKLANIIIDLSARGERERLLQRALEEMSRTQP